MKTSLKSAALILGTTVVCLLYAAQTQPGPRKPIRNSPPGWPTGTGYQSNNQDKIGQLIQQAKQRPEAFSRLPADNPAKTARLRASVGVRSVGFRI
jgi:hypothetical protein